MKILLLMVGKTDDKFIADAIATYAKRINFHIPFQIDIIPEIKNARSLSQAEQKTAEGILILKKLQPTDHVILLDERGQQYSSIQFAQCIENKMQALHRQLAFVIGGPYGFSEQIYARANQTLSLSKMTFTHQMVRLIFAEQLYRATTILRNEPYHHE